MLNRLTIEDNEYLLERVFFPEILQLVEKSTQNILLFGHPGAGKTTSLKSLGEKLKDKYNGSIIKLPLIDVSSTPEEFITYFLETLDENLVNFPPGRKGYNEGSGAEILHGIIKHLDDDAAHKDKKHILLIDDLDEVFVLANFPSEKEFPRKFISLIAKNHKNLVILASTAFPQMIQRKMEERDNSYILEKEFYIYDIKCLTTDEVIEMTSRDRIEHGIDEKEMREWLDFSGRLPVYATLAPYMALSEGKSTNEIIKSVITSPGNPLNIYCNYLYNWLVAKTQGSGITKRLLSILALEAGLSLTEISIRLLRGRGPTRYYLNWLEEVNLVDRIGKKYYIRDRVLSGWLYTISSGFRGAGIPVPEYHEASFGDVYKESEIKSTEPMEQVNDKEQVEEVLSDTARLYIVDSENNIDEAADDVISSHPEKDKDMIEID